MTRCYWQDYGLGQNISLILKYTLQSRHLNDCCFGVCLSYSRLATDSRHLVVASGVQSKSRLVPSFNRRPYRRRRRFCTCTSPLVREALGCPWQCDASRPHLCWFRQFGQEMTYALTVQGDHAANARPHRVVNPPATAWCVNYPNEHPSGSMGACGHATHVTNAGDHVCRPSPQTDIMASRLEVFRQVEALRKEAEARQDTYRPAFLSSSSDRCG